MRSMRLTLCTGALAVAALTPTTAYAADGGGVAVTPAAPAPGTDVTLRVAECAERTAVAVSAAFVSEVRLSVSDGVLVGESRVRSSLTAGVYDVKVNCGGTDRRGTITVAPARTPSGGHDEPAGDRPTAPASPVAPVDAGGGGTARLASAEAEDGPGTAQVVTGLALAGAAAVAVARGRVRRSGGTA
ncbi:hypothetical protein [Streptomyces sp. NPDC029526]|uniref:hypothetical protein n=1 Tax=Streptomyces sp. NPDC029526 TaxID=3155728 RepID=UPI0033E04D1F